jgi:hypothetical protein
MAERGTFSANGIGTWRAEGLLHLSQHFDRRIGTRHVFDAHREHRVRRHGDALAVGGAAGLSAPGLILVIPFTDDQRCFRQPTATEAL